jgi:hypothetical protein
MYTEQEVLEKVKRIENCIMQYKEGAVLASEMAAAIIHAAVDVLDNTPTAAQVFPEEQQ